MGFGDGINWDYHVKENLESEKKGATIFYKPEGAPSTFEDAKNFVDTETPVKDRKALDCGCHMGRFIDMTEAYGFEYTGVDQSEVALEYAKKQRPKGNWVHKFLWDMGYKEEFDLAFTNAVLQHNLLSEQERIVPEIFKALKPGGVFMMTESTEPKNTKTQRTHDDWIKMVESCGFKFIKSSHKNPIGYEDRYFFLKPTKMEE